MRPTKPSPLKRKNKPNTPLARYLTPPSPARVITRQIPRRVPVGGMILPREAASSRSRPRGGPRARDVLGTLRGPGGNATLRGQAARPSGDHNPLRRQDLRRGGSRDRLIIGHMLRSVVAPRAGAWIETGLNPSPRRGEAGAARRRTSETRAARPAADFAWACVDSPPARWPRARRRSFRPCPAGRRAALCRPPTRKKFPEFFRFFT